MSRNSVSTMVTAASASANTTITDAIGCFIESIDKMNDFRSCYLTGSYADKYSVAGVSDIDLCLISCGELDECKKKELDQTINKLSIINNVSLDVSLVSSNLLDQDVEYKTSGVSFREAIMAAKLSGIHIWGDDVLKDWQLPSIDKYVENTKVMPLEFFDRARNYRGLSGPLDYPNADDPYYGYVILNGDNQQTTKQLISIYTWIGTGKIALTSGKFIGNKQQCVNELKNISPQEGEYLEEVFNQCRRTWGYKVPCAQEDQDKLKVYCAKALEWENNYISDYFPHLIKSQNSQPS